MLSSFGAVLFRKSMMMFSSQIIRLLKLYGAFELNPYISAKCGNEYSNRDPAAFNEDITCFA